MARMINDSTENRRADTDPNKLLVNDLTIGDARHLLATEGGPLDASQLVVRGISIAVVAVACAYAIWAGHATVWHLALPMVGEYVPAKRRTGKNACPPLVRPTIVQKLCAVSAAGGGGGGACTG
jgi:hypothetical protein